MKIANVLSYCPNAGNNRKNISKQEKTGTNSYVQFSSAASNAIRNNAIASINFKGKEEGIEDIVAKLKNEYGIDAKFNNLYTAKTTLECVEDFVKLNNRDIFKGLKIDTFEEDKKYLWATSSNYTTKEFKIRLNNFKNKEEVAEMVQNDYDNCLIPTKNEKYQFYEALANFIEFNYNPYAYTNNFRNGTEIFSDNFLECARKISDGATISFERFNTAYIAAKMCGLEIPTDAKKFFIENCGTDINLPKPKIVKSQFDKNADFATVSEAEEHLKQYGIEAEFENLTSANLTVSAIEDFIQINDNPDMFKGLKIGKEVVGNSIFGTVRTGFDYAKNEITNCELLLNSAYDWSRHKNRAWINYSSGHYASADEKYSVYHELAHWLHFQNSPEKYSRTADKFKFGQISVNDYGKRVFGRVSGYAAKSSIEFVAEYVAARMCGHKFPKSVDDEYMAYTNLSLKFPEETRYY